MAITISPRVNYITRSGTNNITWSDGWHSHQTAYQVEYKPAFSSAYWQTLSKTTSTANTYNLSSLGSYFPDFVEFYVRVKIHYGTAFADVTGGLGQGYAYTPSVKVIFKNNQATTTAGLHSRSGAGNVYYPAFTAS